MSSSSFGPVSIFFGLLALASFIFLVLLIGRLILDWVQVFARDWRPRGPVLVISEVVYTVTDPPLKALRRVIPPLTIGQIRLDLGFMVLFFVTYIVYGIASAGMQ